MIRRAGLSGRRFLGEQIEAMTDRIEQLVPAQR
jgi:hypothetical protein